MCFPQHIAQPKRFTPDDSFTTCPPWALTDNNKQKPHILTWVSLYQAVHARLIWKSVVHQVEQPCQEGGEEGSQAGVENEVKYADFP